MADRSIVQTLLVLPEEWTSRLAFASGKGQLSFGALREGVLRCREFLHQRHHVVPGTLVAICLPKSLEAIQIIWGILAAGAAYVPLQFQGPPARLNAILRSTEPRLLVTTARMADQLAAEAGWPAPPVCCLEIAEAGRGLAPILSGFAPETDLPANGPDDLAVIYFTSGSTGQPKGVMLSHGNIQASLRLIAERDAMTGRDRLLSHTSLHYAAYDVFLPIVVGCQTFLLADSEAMLPGSVAAALERERTTVWRSTKTALRHLFESGELAARDLSAIRLLGMFGEPMPIPFLRQLMAALPVAGFSFVYGATEAYRISSYDIPRILSEDLVSLPIGREEMNTVTLRDEEDREVDDGAVGELCVEGSQVMLGYWKDPHQTDNRRLPGRPRSWRSGDLAYRDAAGLLHLAGRKDQMVKIRGHRFDLGEIEAVLRGQAGVRDAIAVLVAKAEGIAEIHAAVLAEDTGPLRTALRLACFERLPAFARPSFIAVFQTFPTLATGKVDRMALRARLAHAGEGQHPEECAR